MTARTGILLGVVVLAAAGVVGWLVLGGGGRDPKAFAFYDAAAEAGLNWEMRFLPGEQGETFKINLYDHGAGLAVGDFDGDGRDDIYFCNQLGPNALYRNKGDGTFEDVTAAAGVGLGDRVCVAATFADYDNDGRQDLYVTSTRGGNVLFHNEGGGKFRDVSKEAGVGLVAHSQAAVFFDYDNDGRLDLFVANTAAWTTDDYDRGAKYFVGKGGNGFGQVIHSPKELNVLYRNNGDGTFEDVTAAAGLGGRGWAGDAAAFDYNDDGRPDLFVTCMFGRAQLYRNDGGRFTDVTLEVLGKTPWGGLGCRPIDFDNDGRLDLAVADMHSDMWMGPDFEHQSAEVARKSARAKFDYYSGPKADTTPAVIQDEYQLGREVGFKHAEVLFGNALYRNAGGGKFAEVSAAAGWETFWPWGVAAGDFDNDGHEDAFLPSGMGYPFYYWPNALLMNQGNGTFRDRAEELGVEPPARGTELPNPVAGKPAVRSSRAAAVADFDGDGRLELVVNNFNDRPYLFKNQFPQKNSIALRLRGTTSNRDAIGAVVRVYRGGQVLTRQLSGACGYLSQSSKTLHFGLGDDARYDRIEVTWPGGRKQRLDGLAANRVHDITEPAGKGP